MGLLGKVKSALFGHQIKPLYKRPNGPDAKAFRRFVREAMLHPERMGVTKTYVSMLSDVMATKQAQLSHDISRRLPAYGGSYVKAMAGARAETAGTMSTGLREFLTSLSLGAAQAEANVLASQEHAAGMAAAAATGKRSLGIFGMVGEIGKAVGSFAGAWSKGKQAWGG